LELDNTQDNAEEGEDSSNGGGLLILDDRDISLRFGA
jgi:hypothetical protein